VKHPDLGERLAAAADAIAALQTIDAPLDWVDEVIDADGDAIKTDEAAYIAAVSADTIRRRADDELGKQDRLVRVMSDAVDTAYQRSHDSAAVSEETRSNGF
jgi:hypothetical protein